ncbi:MAG: arylsulfotransferase family protein [Solirubrobacteraceae bacterium]
MLAYSQGDGASFLPDKPFAQGELVTVRALLQQGTRTIPIAWRFTVAVRDSVSRSLETPPPPPPPAKASELQHFLSRPDLLPPTVTVTSDRGGHAPGYTFLAPYAGPGQYGPMILNSAGRLVWFKPVPKGSRAADLRVQRYEGRPVLTWWEEPLLAGGRHDGGIVIADSSYRTIKIVRAGNGYQPDLHAFQIAPNGTAVFTVYDAIRCNLTAHKGPADGAVADTLFQEVDLKTGLVRFEWHSLDHVSLSDSYSPVASTGTPKSPWDYFHINAVSNEGGGLLVDSRNTWAAYDVDAHTGKVIWRLGGKKSSFKMGHGARPAWQHDLRREPDGTISFFDNGATPKVHAQSRVIVLRLDTAHMTAKLVSSFVHRKPLVAPSQGDFQPLTGGNWFVGWGQEPYLSEYSSTGGLLFDAHMPVRYQSYTAFKFPWAGAPTERPRLTLTSAAGETVAHVSWNGATGVSRWRVMGGPSRKALAPLATATTHGFETSIPIASPPRYVAAQSLGAGGDVLGTSSVLRF